MDVLSSDTPSLLIDLDRVERNIESMQSYCDHHGLRLRPHIKTHKIPEIARRQVEAGAVGIACQKLGEAEVMAEAGLDDIFVTYPIVGETKVARLCSLAHHVTVSTVADSEVVARGLSEGAMRAGVELAVLVECDTGFGRTGVQSVDEAVALAQLIANLPGLDFAGLMTYPTLPESAAWLRAAREAIENEGLGVATVSGGGTQSARRTHELGEITEVRAGTYVYGDRMCLANGLVGLEECALHVLASVVSRPTAGRAIIDAGTKTLTSDPAGAESGFGLILEHPDAHVYNLNEEHGYVDVSACQRPPAVGDKVTIVPNHACGTTNLHDEAVVHRGGSIVDNWPIAARGKIR